MRVSIANWIAALACVVVMVLSAHQHGQSVGYLLGLSAAFGVAIERNTDEAGK